MKRAGEHWMYKRIVVHPNKRLSEPDEDGKLMVPNYHHSHTLKVFNFPSYMYRKWHWYVTYYFARMQVRFPRHYVSMITTGYWPDGEADMVEIRKRSIAAIQGQITKINNIRNRRKEQLSKELFNDWLNDPLIRECDIKLEQKRFNLQQVISNQE